MLRILWFAIKIGVLVAAAVWVADRPGDITVNWMDYSIHIKAWFALALGLTALFVILLVHRLLLSVLGLRGSVGRFRGARRAARGQRALLLGMTAVAAGDARAAQHQARRARKYIPEDRGMVLLLEADAARVAGDDAGARKSYAGLLQHKDTAFLGMRGLLGAALEKDDSREALRLARKASAMHPKQPWLARLVYRLEILERQWDLALRSLRRVEKTRAMPQADVTRDRQALQLALANDDFDNGRAKSGVEHLKSAYRTDPSFAPASVALAEYYIESGQRRAAVKLVARSWNVNPHPELAELWGRLAPAAKTEGAPVRLRWFERLAHARPDAQESQLAAAEAAIHDNLWGEARGHLAKAEAIRPSARVFRLKARIEEELHHPSEARHWLRKAEDALPDPVWSCRDTGRIYARWQPVADPHGAFNTIFWGLPALRRIGMQDLDDGRVETALLPRMAG